jgi:hypothetical protein
VTNDETIAMRWVNLLSVQRSQQENLRNRQEWAVGPIQRMLKAYHFRPYKVHGDDTDRRVEFNEWFLSKENLMSWVC